MISENLYQEGGAVKVMPPRFEGTDDGEEFAIIDVVVLLCRGE